jgi:hypothetical protein
MMERHLWKAIIVQLTFWHFELDEHLRSLLLLHLLGWVIPHQFWRLLNDEMSLMVIVLFDLVDFDLRAGLDRYSLESIVRHLRPIPQSQEHQLGYFSHLQS